MLKPNQSRRRLIYLATALLTLAGFFTAAAPASAVPCYDFPCSGTDAVAHRGDIQHHPENTWEAIESAVAKGADWVEIDVHYNWPSGRLILFHDSSCGGYSVEASSVASLAACRGTEVVYFDDLLDHFTPLGFDRWVVAVEGGLFQPHHCKHLCLLDPARVRSSGRAECRARLALAF